MFLKHFLQTKGKYPFLFNKELKKILTFKSIFFFQKPIGALEKRTKCCLCCKSNRVVLQCLLERSAYVCGEALRLKANIKNQNEKDIRLIVRVIQVKLFFYYFFYFFKSVFKPRLYYQYLRRLLLKRIMAAYVHLKNQTY